MVEVVIMSCDATHLAECVGAADFLRVIGDEEADGVCHDLDAAGVDHDLGLLRCKQANKL